MKFSYADTKEQSYNTAQIVCTGLCCVDCFQLFISDEMGRAFRQHLEDSNNAIVLQRLYMCTVRLGIIALVVCTKVIVRFLAKKTQK